MSSPPANADFASAVAPDVLRDLIATEVKSLTTSLELKVRNILYLLYSLIHCGMYGLDSRGCNERGVWLYEGFKK